MTAIFAEADSDHNDILDRDSTIFGRLSMKIITASCHSTQRVSQRILSCRPTIDFNTTFIFADWLKKEITSFIIATALLMLFMFDDLEIELFNARL